MKKINYLPLLVLITLCATAMEKESQFPLPKALPKLAQYLHENPEEHIKFPSEAIDAVSKYRREQEPRLIYAAEKGDADLVARLIARGVNVNAKDKQGNTALMKAAYAGNTPIVMLLLDKKASVSLKNKSGHTALEQTKNKKIQFLLLNYQPVNIQTPYEILGIPSTATAEDIEAAYKKLTLEYHPDRNPGSKEAEEKFKEATSAYKILSDSNKRSQYDKMSNPSYGK